MADDDFYTFTGDVNEFKDYDRVKDLLEATERAGNVRFARVEIWPFGLDGKDWAHPKIVVTAGASNEGELAQALGPLIASALDDTYGQLLQELIRIHRGGE